MKFIKLHDDRGSRIKVEDIVEYHSAPIAIIIETISSSGSYYYDTNEERDKDLKRLDVAVGAN